MNRAATLTTRQLTLSGRVQGVGFRPFVYRLAHDLSIHGWVYNASGQVVILAQADASTLDEFERRLVSDAPPLSRPVLNHTESVKAEPVGSFEIHQSHGDGEVDIHLPPDQFACDDCIAEMNDPTQRRYHYPFTNCTQCGPRYTIIKGMPYDRPNTTMQDFPLCPECAAEYSDPLDRRFHAQPLACPVCGPSLTYVHNSEQVDGNEASLLLCLRDLAAGAIIAVKGIGGYHLICDATNDDTVSRLRQRKHRPAKPFAIMVPWKGGDGLTEAYKIANLSQNQAASLTDPMRPVVLSPIKHEAPLAPSVAPGLDEVGLMLPYSPLHHLLLERWNGPLVATSGNISGEPVITDPDEAQARLANIADSFMHHNRPIHRPADDPVMRESNGLVRPIRLGRGNSPLELTLPFELDEPLLATGAFLKNTVALAWRDRVVISPHIGDLDSRRSREVFVRVARDLQEIYGATASTIACDAHPDYANTRWARDTGLETIRVFHHHAHASALAGEFGITEPMLTFTWDGVGLGEDKTAWGGEAFFGQPGAWKHVASFEPWRLPGGDRAVYEPWRIALSLAWQLGIDWPDAPSFPPMLHDAWKKSINAPLTSAVGRLFDAAAVFAGLLLDASYEGEAPMRLEAAAGNRQCGSIALPLNRDGDILRAELSPLVSYLANSEDDSGLKAAVFQESLAQLLCQQAKALDKVYGIRRVGLCGGVFQNRRLGQRATCLLNEAGFDVHLPRILPVNDAAISYGQIIEAGSLIRTHKKICESS